MVQKGQPGLLKEVFRIAKVPITIVTEKAANLSPQEGIIAKEILVLLCSRLLHGCLLMLFENLDAQMGSSSSDACGSAPEDPLFLLLGNSTWLAVI